MGRKEVLLLQVMHETRIYSLFQNFGNYAEKRHWSVVIYGRARLRLVDRKTSAIFHVERCVPCLKQTDPHEAGQGEVRAAAHCLRTLEGTP